MLIHALKLYTHKLDELKNFYSQVLGVKLYDLTKDKFTMEVGQTILTFIESSRETYYHFAINIPSFQIQAAYEWLKGKTTILPFKGREIVDFKDWNAEAIYFYDPAGNIVELIARKNLQIESITPFSPSAFLNVSEMGLPVKSVKEASGLLNKECGLEKYSGDFNRFCALGEETGLFIIIDYQQKDWIPNGDKALPFPFEILFKHNQKDYNLVYKGEKLKLS